MIKLTTEAYLDTGKNSLCERNAGCLAEYLGSLIGKAFGGWTIKDGESACYVYGEGYDGECRPAGAISLHGSDLPEVLRKFAENVADGALSRFNVGGKATLALDIEICNEEFGGGVHVTVSEQISDNDEGALYRWTLDQLPACVWIELLGKRGAETRRQ